jgi:hypothetical protein
MAEKYINEQFNIDLNGIKALKDFVPVYHAEQDTFFVRPEKPVPATSYDCDGELWLRVNPETGVIVGIEIENFESVFLKKHPEIAKAWKDVRPYCIRRRIPTYDDEICESFLKIIINLLSSFFKDNPLQGQFSIP